MGRKSLKEPRQKEIIKAFYKLAKKEGLENASIAKIADIIGIQPSHIIHYFRTKEYLIYALVEHILYKYVLIFEIKNDAKMTSLQRLLAVIENLFSKKWNLLFDDSVSYSCYSLAFRNKTIRNKYEIVLKTLRKKLKELIDTCQKERVIKVENSEVVADIIFVLIDGAYYYLSVLSDKKEYEIKLKRYKQQALNLLNIPV